MTDTKISVMKKYILFFTCFLYTFPLFAGEGMWLPFLLKQVNEKEMRDMGLKITAEDIYSVNNGSLKDAVLIFGGGCTGEVISNQGLVLTNHHCGYGSVQRLSSVENDYLTNGFFSKNKSDYKKILEESKKAIKYAQSLNPKLQFEVGTDENFGQKL